MKTISAKSRRALFARPFFDKRVKAMERCEENCKNPDKATLYSSQGQRLHNTKTNTKIQSQTQILIQIRVAELGSLSSGPKMAIKIFVKRIFAIFASNASFLRVIANLQN